MIVATAFWSETSLRFVLLGLATGSLTALVALGIVLVYRASGVLNFAAGALGGLAAFVCYELREAGTPGWAAATVGILIGAALGVVTFLALALLRNAGHHVGGRFLNAAPSCLELDVLRERLCALRGIGGEDSFAIAGLRTAVD